MAVVDEVAAARTHQGRRLLKLYAHEAKREAQWAAEEASERRMAERGGY